MGELRDIKRRVEALLESLGHDPDEVASALEVAGVQGVPRSNASCAVALYASAVMQTDPRIKAVAVGPCTLILTLLKGDGRPGGKLTVQLPKPVRGFVGRFDTAQYPRVLRLQSTEPLASSPVEVSARAMKGGSTVVSARAFS
jgi:hypothetical protein